ncbi:hypothetical protein GCM10022254_41380 [Actinomadura meridiana]|uniref:FAD-binding PCMH-type domain-containing protein n=1 Tax=Actinomadura meridiana TaxID=559626 RepID=A0ABP8C7M5_9ACTN
MVGVVGVVGEQDVAAAERMAVAQGRAVSVMATGHSSSVLADGAVLINTGRMNGVEVNPRTRSAWAEAGARWRQVVERAAPHGLAPLACRPAGVPSFLWFRMMLMASAL